MKTPIKLYKSLSDLSIYNFNQYVETNDLRYLIVDWDEESKVKFNEQDAKKRWDDIYEMYCKKSGDNATMLLYSLKQKIFELEAKKYIVAKLIHQIITYPKTGELLESYIEELGAWGYKINRKKDFVYEINKVIRHLKVLDSVIELRREEADEITKSNDDEVMTLSQQVVSVEYSLNKNEIDPRKTSVEKWLDMIDKIKEISKQQKQAA